MTKLEEALNDKKNKIIAYTDQFGQGKTTSILKLKEEVEKREGNNKEFIIYESFYYEWVGNNKIHFIFEILNKMGLPTAMELLKDKEKPSWYTNMTKWFDGIDATLKIPFLDVKASFKRPEREKNYILNTLLKFKSQTDYLIKFKKSVEEYLKEKNKEIILVVDDLDRINPHSAIEIIEIVKHFFDIPNFQIILIFDKECMNEIYEKIFGKRNGEAYLNKYINTWVEHTRPSLEESIELIHALIEKKLNSEFVDIISIRQLINGEFKKFIKHLGEATFYTELTEELVEIAIYFWGLFVNNSNIFKIDLKLFYNQINNQNRNLRQFFINPKKLKFLLNSNKINFSTNASEQLGIFNDFIEKPTIEIVERVLDCIVVIETLNALEYLDKKMSNN